MAGQPKAPFYIVLFLVVGGLVAFAYYRATNRGVQRVAPANPPGNNAPPVNNNQPNPTQAGATDTGAKTAGEHIEQPSDEGITTVKEYTRLAPAAERLPKPKGTSSYKALTDTD